MSSAPETTAGLYVHVPFCETKCGYCDFYSVTLAERDTSRLTRALLRELEERLPTIEGDFHTIFAGGGTPTLLPIDDMRALFTRLGALAREHGVVEFTTEANPATIDESKITLLGDCGVNRLSLGGQSFHENELQALERLHSPADIEPGIRMARAGGIKQINLDLIFGIPGQTMASWRESLQRAVDLGTDHLACYGLTYEPNTPLAAQVRQGSVTPCDNELEAEMYLMCLEFLAEHGFEQYEISNFARPGRECKHNLIYWSNMPYLGIGPSAASYIDGERIRNVAQIERYTDDIETGRGAERDREKLTGKAKAGETAMLQLRLNRGIDVARFKTQVGLDPLELYREELATFAAQGLLEFDSRQIRLTPAGRLVADRIIGELLVDDTPDAKGSPLRVLPT